MWVFSGKENDIILINYGYVRLKFVYIMLDWQLTNTALISALYHYFLEVNVPVVPDS